MYTPTIVFNSNGHQHNYDCCVEWFIPYYMCASETRISVYATHVDINYLVEYAYFDAGEAIYHFVEWNRGGHDIRYCEGISRPSRLVVNLNQIIETVAEYTKLRAPWLPVIDPVSLKRMLVTHK